MKAIIFDLFGTLVPYVGNEDFKQSLLSTSTALEIDFEILVKEICNDKRFDLWTKNKIELNKEFEKLCKKYGVQYTEDSLNKATQTRIDEHRKWMINLDKNVKTISKIKSKLNRIGLMSVCSYETVLVWNGSKIQQYFDVANFSCEIGLDKNDKEYYYNTCKKLNVEPQYCYYVGDSLTELTIAKELGMKVIRKKTENLFDWQGIEIRSISQLKKII